MQDLIVENDSIITIYQTKLWHCISLFTNISLALLFYLLLWQVLWGDREALDVIIAFEVLRIKCRKHNTK